MSLRTTNRVRITMAAIAGTLWSLGPALAADSAEEQYEESLQARLARSERQVEALTQRIEHLERNLSAPRTASMYRANITLGSQTQPLAQASPAPSRPQPPAPEEGRSASRSGGSAAGAFEVDEAAAQRALERTLTQTGALLLPSRVLEVTPTFGYVRNERTRGVPATVIDPRTGSSGFAVVDQRARTNDVTLGLDLRVGLPLSTQFEATLPFNHVRTSLVDDFGNARSDNASGVGDISVGMAKTFMREQGPRPDLIGRLTYNFGNGKRQSGIVGFNSGFRQLQAEAVALKRQDPLAFTASAFYSKIFEKDSVKPGDVIGATLGAALAASPATSMQFNFTQIYQQKQELNGRKLAGSDQTYGIFGIGASSVLTRDVTLVTQFGIGVGNDAPKYTVTVALPILFR